MFYKLQTLPGSKKFWYVFEDVRKQDLSPIQLSKVCQQNFPLRLPLPSGWSTGSLTETHITLHYVKSAYEICV